MVQNVLFALRRFPDELKFRDFQRVFNLFPGAFSAATHVCDCLSKYSMSCRKAVKLLVKYQDPEILAALEESREADGGPSWLFTDAVAKPRPPPPKVEQPSGPVWRASRDGEVKPILPVTANAVSQRRRSALSTAPISQAADRLMLSSVEVGVSWLRSWDEERRFAVLGLLADRRGPDGFECVTSIMMSLTQAEVDAVFAAFPHDLADKCMRALVAARSAVALGQMRTAAQAPPPPGATATSPKGDSRVRLAPLPPARALVEYEFPPPIELAVQPDRPPLPAGVVIRQANAHLPPIIDAPVAVPPGRPAAPGALPPGDPPQDAAPLPQTGPVHANATHQSQQTLAPLPAPPRLAMQPTMQPRRASALSPLAPPASQRRSRMPRMATEPADT